MAKSIRATLALTALFAAAALFAPGGAQAGLQLNAQVTIGTGFFQGNLGSARYSADSVQYIGCTNMGGSAFCAARDAAGTVALCTTSNPTHLDVINAMNDGAFIVAFFDASGNCTTVWNYNSSLYDNK